MTIAGLVGLAVENRKDEKRRVLLKEIKDAKDELDRLDSKKSIK